MSEPARQDIGALMVRLVAAAESQANEMRRLADVLERLASADGPAAAGGGTAGGAIDGEGVDDPAIAALIERLTADGEL